MKRFQDSLIDQSLNGGDYGFSESGGVGQTSQSISVTDIISEGPIHGLVAGAASIYLNDDRAQPLEYAVENYARTPATVLLTQGETEASFVGLIEETIRNPLEPTLKQLLVRSGWGSTTVTLSQGAPNEYRTSRLNHLTTTDVGFFQPGMVTTATQRASTTESITKFSPARLYGSANEGLPIEGIIYHRDDGENVGFQAGVGADAATLIDDGTYRLEVDRVVNISLVGSLESFSATLADPWEGATGYYKFDLSSAILGNILTLESLDAALDTTSTFQGFSAQFRVGTLLQSPMNGEGGVGSTSISHTPTGGPPLEQSTDFGGDVEPLKLVATSQTQGFRLTPEQAQEADEIRLVYSYGNGLYSSRKDGEGDRHNYVFFKVSIAFATLDSPDEWTEEVIVASNLRHAGKSKDAYSFSTVIDLSPFKPYSNFRVTISRKTAHTGDSYDQYGDRTGKLNTAAEVTISSVTTTIKERLNHPYTAYSNVTFSSKQFNSMPTRTYHARGLLVNVPSNYVTREESSTGIAEYTRNSSNNNIEASYQAWNGLFRPVKVYTNNPAWIFYDILVNNRYGLGAFLNSAQIDKYALYRIARYCDELVSDGKGGLEPRFTANIYLTKSSDAYKVIKDFATVFRSMVYWLDGQVFAVTDQPKEPIYNFTKGNVLDGAFSYEGTGSKTRANQIYVSWNNPANNYNSVPVLIEDRNNIIETGQIITSEAVAFGATSEGQAIRYGRWKLWTAINQTEIVSFSTSINAAFIAPGDIVNVQDADRFAIRYSGRIPSVGTRNTTTIPIDSTVTLASGSTYDLSVLIVEPGAFIITEGESVIDTVVYNKGDLVPSITTEEDASNLVDDSGNPIQVNWSEYTRVETQEVTTPSGNVTSLTVGTAFTTTPAAATVWMLKESINGSTVLGSAKQYKVLSISQGSEDKYDITAVVHYNEKFDAVDKEFNLYVEENVLPSITPDSIVPPPLEPHALITPVSLVEGEEFTLQWTPPAPENGIDFAGIDYEFISGYEIFHNMPAHPSPILVSSDTTSIEFTGVEDGTYVLGVRTINTLGNRSILVKTTVTILDRFSTKTVRLPQGLPYGGSSNVGLSINESGTFMLGTDSHGFNYTIESSHPTAAVFSNIEDIDATYKQVCTDLPVITQVEQSSPGAFISEHAYVMLDASDSDDRLKLMKYNDTYSYWFEAGTGSETTGLTTLTGTIVKAANRSRIIGTGTSFTTECKVGEIFKAVSQSEVARIAYIKSDTELVLDRAIVPAYFSQGFQTSNIFVDYTNDTVIARVYRTEDGYFTVPLVTVNASVNEASQILQPKSVTNSEVADQTIVADNIQDGTVTHTEIAQSTITGGNINAGTKIAVYTKENNVIIDDSYAALDGANTTFRIYAGSESPAQAPFSVTKEGLVRAKNIQLTDPNGVVYFDSQVGFTETAIAQIAGATSSRVYNITKTLSGDLNSGDATTYQEIELTETADVTLKTSIPVSTFSKYLSEEYFGGQTPETAVNLEVRGFEYHQRTTNANLTVIRNGVSEPLGRALKGGEVVRVTLVVNYSKNIRNVIGATKIDGSAWPSVTQLSNENTVVLYFKVVAGQEFSFRVGAATTGDQLFKAGGEIDETYYAKQTEPRYHVLEDTLSNNELVWRWNGVVIGTTALSATQLIVGSTVYTKGTTLRHSDFNFAYMYYEITRVATGTGSTVLTDASPDLTQDILDAIPNTVKARLLQRTSPTDTSPIVHLDNFSSNTIQRITSGTPNSLQYLVTADLDNVVSDGLIESDHSIVLSNFAGAANAQGFIEIETNPPVTLAAGTYYFDIDVEFLTAGTTDILEGARVFTASLPTSTAGFLISNGGGSTAPGAGDITAVIAGDGLSGGATSGDATLSVDSTVVRTTGAQNISGDKTFENNVVIEGDLTVGGTTTTVIAENLSVHDNMIYLNNPIETTIIYAQGYGTIVVYTTSSPHGYVTGESVTITGVDPSVYNLTDQTITSVTSDTFTIASSVTGTYVSGGIARARTNANPDLGFAGGYNDGTYGHAGLFRDADDGVWKFFDGYTPEPDASPFIDTTHASYNRSDLLVDQLEATRIQMQGVSSRDKLRVYSDSNYTIGMQSGVNFGSLNSDWAMTFQMNNDSDRGFWWGDAGHTTAQGAMALSTNGKLTVASKIRVGYGESDIVDVFSNATVDIATDLSVGAGGLTIASETVDVATVTSTEIASFVAADFAGAKLTICASEGTHRHICELLVTHDGTTAVSTQYGSVLTNGPLATYDVTLGTGVVRVFAVGDSAISTTYKVAKLMLPA